MANVTFDDEPQYTSARAKTARQGSIMGLMFRLGVAKTQRDATVVLSGVIVACLVVSATMFVMVQPHPRQVDQAQLQRDIARMHATTNTPLPTTH